MKLLLFSRPTVWFCEECRSIKSQLFPKSVVQELRHGALTSTYISSRDVRQSMGGPNVKLSTQSDLHSNHACQADKLITKFNGSPRFETPLSKLTPQEVNADPSVRAVPHCNPLLGGIEEIHSITQQRVPQTSKELKGKNWIVCKEEPVEILQAEGSRVDIAADTTPPPSVNALPIISSGDVLSADVLAQSFDIQASNLDPKDEPDNSFLLTSYAIWWSKEQYNSLLELLEMRDLVLKSCINGVELLIFSSKILQANSSGFKLGSFLWGVYREVQGKLEGTPVLSPEMTSQDGPHIQSNTKQSLSKVKIEPDNHCDVPPGFPRRAADADARRISQLSYTS